MTSPSPPPDCISLILGDRITLDNVSSELAAFLQSAGAHEEPGTSEGWVLTANGAAAVAHLLEQLRDRGTLFVGGPAGWPPASIFQDLRDRGLAAGAFNEVVWHSKDEWIVRTR